MERGARRVVTGHDEDGRSRVVEDGPSRAVPLGNDGLVFHEIWQTCETPARIGLIPDEPTEQGVFLLPAKNGTRLRFLDFPPEREDASPITPELARASFATIGAPDAAMHRGEGSPHPFMHRTETIDYGIVLEGEIILVLDGGETALKAGDVVVQRGTSHAWANRSGRNCRMAFILIDGVFEQDLASRFTV
jgi:mannose-6-phosphate isomerase-like protein (cupin superfamily)